MNALSRVWQLLVAAQTTCPKCHLVVRMKPATAAGSTQLNDLLGKLFSREDFVSASSHISLFPFMPGPQNRFGVPKPKYVTWASLKIN